MKQCKSKKMLIQCLFTILLIADQLDPIISANILAFFPAPGRSHFKPFEQFFKTLAHRGHNVTAASAFPSNEPIVGYNEVEFKKRPSGGLNFAETRKQYRIQNWIYIFDMVVTHSTYITNQTQFHQLMKSSGTQFDLVFVEMYHTDPFFLLGQKFDCPIIGVSFQPLVAPYNWMLKNPLTFSFIPHLYLPFTDHMNFGQRLVNSAFNLFTWLFYYSISMPVYQQQATEIWKLLHEGLAPPYAHDFQRLSMVFVETHFSAGHIRPNLPNVIDVGGIHIQKPKPLPQDLQEFMDASENGVILLSLGTLLRPEDMNEIGVKLFNVLSKLPYHVIWKWKTNLISNSSRKIMIREWLPQLDILNHPKCKLFISHGGYHSVLETIYSGVPILGIPFFTDQYHNAAIVEKFGIGTKTSHDANEQDLENIIQGVLNNDKYYENCQLQSKIFKDRPMSPMDTAVYWTEYVLRYEGAYHLKSAATELYWFQYLGLDVMLVYITVICILSYLISKLCLKLYSYLATLQLKNQNKLKIS